MQNYYETLGIPKNASKKEIETVYKGLAKIYHPDVYRGDKKHAAEKMKDINEAYRALIDNYNHNKHSSSDEGNEESYNRNKYSSSDEENAGNYRSSSKNKNTKKSFNEITSLVGNITEVFKLIFYCSIILVLITIFSIVLFGLISVMI